TEVLTTAFTLILGALVMTIWVIRSIVIPMRQATAALEDPEWSGMGIYSSSHDEVSELIRAATTRRPVYSAKSVSSAAAGATPSRQPVAESRDSLEKENQDLKALVAELLLESRSAKTKTASGD